MQTTFSSWRVGLFVLLSLLLPGLHSVQAGSATWGSNPSSSDWNTASNWSPQTVPNGPSDSATFATSNLAIVTLSAPIEINSAVFQPGASAFSISLPAGPFAPSLTLSGAGVTNDSGVSQSFVAQWGADSGSPTINFTGNATAGVNTNYTAQGGQAPNTTGGVIQFFESSSAGGGAFVSQGSGFAGVGAGTVTFHDNSTADAATITADAGTAANTVGGVVGFYDDSTAGTATLIANGSHGGQSGGMIRFFDTTSLGSPRVVVLGNGTLDLTGHDPAVPLSIGSLEGTGSVNLGATNLIVGSNRRTTTFSGPMFGSGGKLTKVGNGRLALTKGNGYDGGTIVKEGILLANNRSGSATGIGPVRVMRGALGGNGQIVAGAVTLVGSPANLQPGNAPGAIGTLTIVSSLTFQNDSIYNVDMDTVAATADSVIAQGVTLGNSARINLLPQGASPIPVGTVFTIINNTSADSISGAFSNLPDGSSIIVGGNTFHASYEGGDGNDLTLTVVP